MGVFNSHYYSIKAVLEESTMIPAAAWQRETIEPTCFAGANSAPFTVTVNPQRPITGVTVEQLWPAFTKLVIDQGMSCEDVATMFGVSRHTVADAVKRSGEKSSSSMG